MSISFTVIGHFANGQRRVAGLHWPGGPTKVQKGLMCAFRPEFQQRAVQYAQRFKTELEDAPKREDGLPKFEYIEVVYQVHPPVGRAVVGKLYLAVTDRALDKLKKQGCGIINFEDSSVRARFMQGGYAGVVDMTKFRNVNAFWSKVRLYANYVYQPVFAA